MRYVLNMPIPKIETLVSQDSQVRTPKYRVVLREIWRKTKYHNTAKTKTSRTFSKFGKDRQGCNSTYKY